MYFPQVAQNTRARRAPLKGYLTSLAKSETQHPEKTESVCYLFWWMNALAHRTKVVHLVSTREELKVHRLGLYKEC